MMSEENKAQLEPRLADIDSTELLKMNERIPMYRIGETAENSERVSQFLRILNRYVGGFNTSFSLSLYSPFYRIEKGYLYYYPNLLHKHDSEQGTINIEPYKHSLLDTNATKDGKLKLETVFAETNDFDFLYSFHDDVQVGLEEAKSQFSDMAFKTLKQEGEFIDEKNRVILPEGSKTKMSVLRWKKQLLDILGYDKSNKNDEQIRKNDIATKKAHILTTVRNILYANNPEWGSRIWIDRDKNEIKIDDLCIDKCNEIIHEVVKDVSSYNYIDFKSLFDALNISYNPITSVPNIVTQDDLINFFYAITYSETDFGDGDHKSQIDTAQDHLGIFRNSLLTRLYTKKIADRESLDEVHNEVEKIIEEMNKSADDKFWIESRMKSEMSADNKQVNEKDTFRDGLGLRIYINQDISPAESEDASKIMIDFLKKFKTIQGINLPDDSIEYDPKFMKDKILKMMGDEGTIMKHIADFKKLGGSDEENGESLPIVAREKSKESSPEISLLPYDRIDIEGLKKDTVVSRLFKKEGEDIDYIDHILRFLDQGRKTGGFGSYEDRKTVVKYEYNNISQEQMSGMEVQIVSSQNKNEVDLANHTYVLDPMKYIFAQLRSTSNIQYSNALLLVKAGIDKFLREFKNNFNKKPKRLQEQQIDNIKSCKIGDKVYNFASLMDSLDPKSANQNKQNMSKDILDTIISRGRLNMGYFADDSKDVNIYNDILSKDISVIDFIPPLNISWVNGKPKHNGLRLKDGRISRNTDMGTITNAFTSLIPVLDNQGKQCGNKYISVRAHILKSIQRRAQFYEKKEELIQNLANAA